MAVTAVKMSAAKGLGLDTGTTKTPCSNQGNTTMWNAVPLYKYISFGSHVKADILVSMVWAT